jgi:superfamily II RNA helicase
MIVPTNGSDENDPRRTIISFCDTYSHGSSSSIGDDTTTSTCRQASAFRRRTRAGERRRRRSRQKFSSSCILAPCVIALIVVASYVPISRLGACHAFIIAPSNHRVPDPTPATALPRRSRTSSVVRPPTLTVSPTERRSEAKVRLYQAKKSRTTERNRRNAADLTSSVDDAPTAGDASRSNDDRLRRRKQQQEAFVELGRESFAQYFAYDLDDWQLEAGGAIASGHNVIVCGTSHQNQRALYVD